MSNQASEELSLRQKIVNCFNGDDFVPVRAIDNIEDLIRTEKLKLLAEMRERAEMVVGNVFDPSGEYVSVSEIDKLEAEL